MSLFATLDTLEYPIIRTLQNLDGTLLDAFFMSVSNIPFMIVSFGIVVAYMIWKRHRLWKPLLFALLVAIIIDSVVNEWFFKTILVHFGIFRPRPWTIHPDILGIGHHFMDSSFPSSHMAFTTLMAIIVTYFERRFLPYGVIIIVLMWLSRIHNGMHYPSDVLVGTLMGIIYGFLGLFLMKRFWLEKKEWWKKFF